MKVVLQYSLWFVLLLMTLGLCFVAALILHDRTMNPPMRLFSGVGAAYCAADMMSAVRLWPWRDHREPQP